MAGRLTLFAMTRELKLIERLQTPAAAACFVNSRLITIGNRVSFSTLQRKSKPKVLNYDGDEQRRGSNKIMMNGFNTTFNT